MQFFQIPKIERRAIGITMVSVCLGMGCLQLWRAETRGAAFERQQSIADAAPIVLNAAHRDAEVLQGHIVLARGVWLPGTTILLDNKVHRQQVGYQVLTALQLDGSGTVALVNRGWVAAPPFRTQRPKVTTPSDPVEIMGIARKFEEHVFEFGHPEPDGVVWQHVRERDYRARSRLDVLPVIVIQTDPEPDRVAAEGLVRDRGDLKNAENPAWRHYGYATLWLVFALMTVGYGFAATDRGRI
jgi:surfeit locus 1 family protein